MLSGKGTIAAETGRERIARLSHHALAPVLAVSSSLGESVRTLLLDLGSR